jgi:hypothetical protein
VLEQIAGGASVARVEGDANAAARLKLLLTIAEWPRELGQDFARDQAGVGQLAEALEDHGEFVAAETGHRVFITPLGA